jgi:hypothetical protein
MQPPLTFKGHRPQEETAEAKEAAASAESDARRTRIPTEGGQHSDDCGQPMIAA